MQAAPNHTNATHSIIRRGVRLTPYSRGFVMAQYLSNDIAHFMPKKKEEKKQNVMWLKENRKSEDGGMQLRF